MKFRSTLADLGGIAAESISIFSANPKAMALFALLTPVIYSLYYLSNMFYAKPLLGHFVLSMTSFRLAAPGSSKRASLLAAAVSDVTLYFAIQWSFLLGAAASSLFFATATVLTSAVAYSGKHSLSLRELLMRTIKSIKNPLITSFYTHLLGLGYFWLAFMLLLPIDLLFLGNSWAFLAASIVLALVAAVLGAYLWVTWTTALVVSVLEERSGIEALGKAKDLVKGSERVGFCLNIVIGVVYVIVYQGMRFVTVKESEGTRIMIVLAVLNALCLVRLFGLVGFTVLYCRCKKSRGEDIELFGSFHYTKVAPLPPITQDMP